MGDTPDPEVLLDAPSHDSATQEPAVRPETVPSPAEPSADFDILPEKHALESAPKGWVDTVRHLPKLYGLTIAERERINSRNKSFNPQNVPPSGTGNSLANGVVIAVVSMASKAYMRGLNSMYTYRLDVLTDAIEYRPPGVGLLTVSNHRSVADDPIMLSAMLPPRIILRPGLMRWGMCSVDICFQSAAMARFITLGKALPVKRFGGITHPFVLDAAEKLASGDWLHMYPEGRVVQKGMGYMKRGVGKMLAVAHERAAMSAGGIAASLADAAGSDGISRAVLSADAGVSDARSGFEPARDTPGVPVVLPIYHEGVENVMPQDPETHKLFSIIPRVGQRMFTIVGDPVDMRDIFGRLMPPCARAGGTKKDPAECVALYEAVAERCALSVRLLRAELRVRVRAEHGIFLGDPYERT